MPDDLQAKIAALEAEAAELAGCTEGSAEEHRLATITDEIESLKALMEAAMPQDGDDRLKRAAELEAEAAKLRADYETNPPEVQRITYLIENEPGNYSVGCRAEPQIGPYPYRGPCANVYAKDGRFYVNTDDYEGNAMLNIETLPKLIEALQKLQAHIETSQPVIHHVGREKRRPF